MHYYSFSYFPPPPLSLLSCLSLLLWSLPARTIFSPPPHHHQIQFYLNPQLSHQQHGNFYAIHSQTYASLIANTTSSGNLPHVSSLLSSYWQVWSAILMYVLLTRVINDHQYSCWKKHVPRHRQKRWCVVLVFLIFQNYCKTLPFHLPEADFSIFTLSSPLILPP